MKTILVCFDKKFAQQCAIFFYSVELTVLLSWSEEGFMGEVEIYCVLKINSETAAIPFSLQVEKLREKTFIKLKK